MTSPEVSIIMPVYNEGPTLRTAVERALATDIGTTFEVVIVDDGSDDGAVDSVADLAPESSLKIVRHQQNRGKGAAIRTGIAQSSGTVITILDADLEYDPTDYRSMLEAMKTKGAEVVYGTRSFGAHTAFSFWYVLGNRFLGFWASFLFNTWLSDIETCFKMAEASTWRSLGLQSNGFAIEAEATGKFLRRGHRIFEVPITYTARTRDEGKKLHWTDGVIAFGVLLWIRVTGKR